MKAKNSSSLFEPSALQPKSLGTVNYHYADLNQLLLGGLPHGAVATIHEK